MTFPISRVCTGCLEDLPLTEFYKHKRDGLTTRCKECTKAKVISYRNSNLGKVREYDRSRVGQPKRKEKSKEFQKTHPDRHLAANTSYFERNPLKREAHHKVSSAIRNGSLTALPCEVCGDPEVEGHHDDYTKPLDVRWLCDKHHKEHHRNQRDLERLFA